MNIAVLVKLVPDTEATLKIAEDRRQIVKTDVNFVLNPFDEYALEEALRTREKFGGAVTVFSLGGEDALKALRNSLAMGADEAVHIKSAGGLDMVGTARALAEGLRGKGYDLIFAGKQAVDDDCGAIGPMVAEFLEISHASIVVKLEITDGKLTAHREIEGGIELLEMAMPALVTAQKGLNEPRYASLKGIMAAKKKTVTELAAIETQAKTEIVRLEYPPLRPPGKIVGTGTEAVPELLRLLREEAKVI